MTPRIIDLPGVQVPATCQVERAVLVTLLRAMTTMACGFYDPQNRCMAITRIRDEFESGARDRLTAAEWREIGGGD